MVPQSSDWQPWATRGPGSCPFLRTGSGGQCQCAVCIYSWVASRRQRLAAGPSPRHLSAPSAGTSCACRCQVCHPWVEVQRAAEWSPIRGGPLSVNSQRNFWWINIYLNWLKMCHFQRTYQSPTVSTTGTPVRLGLSSLSPGSQSVWAAVTARGGSGGSRPGPQAVLTRWRGEGALWGPFTEDPDPSP